MPKKRNSSKITEKIEQVLQVTKSKIKIEGSDTDIEKVVTRDIASSIECGSERVTLPQAPEIDYITDLKDWQRSKGLRPCANEKCANCIDPTAPPQAKY